VRERTICRALLVMDVQNEYFTGALPITHPVGHRGFTVEFLSDATGTLPLANSAGEVTAEELQRSYLCAQAQLLSEVIPSSTWIERLP
jgi:nicotinamidase-related amidase